MSDYANTPTTALADGETILTSFTATRATYIRDDAWMAAAAMAAGMVVLWLMGNPHIWTGAIGGLAAVAFRAAFLASDELSVRWDLTNQRVLGPGTRAVRLAEIDKVRTLGSAVQIITLTGDKYLIKYQADREATRKRILQAKAGRHVT